MKVLIDMNLSPEWVSLLQSQDVDACHWSTVGQPNATDAEIMRWAREHQAVVFTHDLDFGAILAHTQDNTPSVVQVRAQNISPKHLGEIVLRVLRERAEELRAGALITIDEGRARVRILPL